MISKLFFIFSLILSIDAQCDRSDHSYIGDLCYSFPNTQLKITDAKSYCHSLNQNLAVIHSLTQNNFLASLVRTRTGSSIGKFWIGLSRLSISSPYYWDDGTPLGWSNFESNSQRDQLYVAESTVNGKWHTLDGSQELDFVCSYDPKGKTTRRQESTFATTPTVAFPSTTKTPAPSCTRHTNTTFLFAYSTDLDLQTFRSAMSTLVYDKSPSMAYMFTTYANIRLDTKLEEEIQYHNDVLSFNSSVWAHQPDPSVGYTDKSGSNLYIILKSFLNNPKIPKCGAFVCLFVKRYPNELDVSDIISKLRANNIFVNFLVNSQPSGGNNPNTMFEVSSKTNGYCIYMGGPNFFANARLILGPNRKPYQFHSQRFEVSGTGRLELGVFRTPTPKTYLEQILVVHTLQNNNDPVTGYLKANYTIESLDGSFKFTGPDSGTGWPRFGTGMVAYPGLNGSTDYKWTIDYDYPTSPPQVIETRMYSGYYHDFLPLPDISTPTDDTPTISDGSTELPATGCSRRTNTTFLYAYSTDIDPFFDGGTSKFELDMAHGQTHMYTTFANVRFDTKHEEEIQYHSDFRSFNSSIFAHLPDPAVGYGDRTTGSDVYGMLKKFLNNPQVSLCGSYIYIVVKRYPNEVDVSDIISQLRANNVFVYIVIHDIPSGGNNPQTLFELSAKTNGYCIFDGDNFWPSTLNGLEAFYTPYQFISQNFVISGTGRIEFPVFKTPNPYPDKEQVLVAITVQNRTIDNNFLSVNYTIASTDGNYVFTGPDTHNGEAWWRFGTGIIAMPYLNGTIDYKWTIDYNYRTSQPEIIEARLYSNYYHDFLAFSD